MVTNKNLTICRKVQSDHSYGIFYGENPLNSAFPLLLLELCSLIVISHVVRFLLKPLRQPKVVSQIIGGIILGPSVLSRSEKFRKHMFPDNAQHVIRNIGVIGFMYFLFLSGVKMDILAIRRLDRKHWYIATVGITLPLACSVTIAVMERKSLDGEAAKASSIWGMASSLAISAFPVQYYIVKELNLLSSEMGKMALSIAVISEVIGVSGVVIFEASKQGEYRPIAALWYVISLIVVMASIMGGVRQATIWIVRTTPEGKPVDEVYVIAILLGVMVFGFIADMFGLAIANGPFWLGLAIPDGPPVGAILVEKTETIVMNILLPFSFMYVGMITDLSFLSSHWSHLQPLFFMVLGGYTIKIVCTLVVSCFLDMTFRDSLTLSLITSLRGEVELLLFIHWMDFKMVGQPYFTLLVLVSMLMTALSTPLICIVYDPMRPYMVNKRRSIQHTPPNSELHMVACIHGEENLYGLMKLLELSNPTANRPFSVNALHHIELVGRANPVFIDHEKEKEQTDQSRFSSIHNALKIFQEARGECLKIHSYTAITPKGSMYQDICELALSKQASLIILLLHRDALDSLNVTRAIKKKGHQSVSSNVLAHAPCSVGILVDKSPYNNIFDGISRGSTHHFVVLFLGGADAREALSYADRVAASAATSLTVIRFLSQDDEADNETDKKLDDALVTSFWMKYEGNGRIVYREVVVKNGEETIAAIQAMNNECYDLWIVGRKQGINHVLVRGLPVWRENTELGVIGEYVASQDFDSEASVLVVQQQILRGQEKTTGFSWCIEW